MKKRITALALFLVMIITLIPISSAKYTGEVTRIELLNQTVAASGKIAANNASIENKDTWTILSLRESYKELQKTSRDYYENGVAKWNLFVDLYLATFTAGTTMPDTEEGLAALAKGYLDPSKFQTNSKQIDGNKKVFDYKDNATVKAIRALTSTDSAGDITLYYRVCVTEFTTGGENRSDEFKFSFAYTGTTSTMNIRVNYENTDAPDKPVRQMRVSPVKTGDDGLYKIDVVNGVIFIDYARDVDFTKTANAVLPVKFTFYDEMGARLPKKGERAYVRADDTKNTTSGSYASGQLFIDNAVADAEIYYEGVAAPANDNLSVGATDGAEAAYDASTTLGIWIPGERNLSTNRTLRLRLETRDAFYQTIDIPVVFRPLPRNQITTAILNERNVTITVGESKTLSISSASATTYDNIRLQELTSVKPYLFVDGMTIKGVAVGTAQLQVTASGRVIDQITVTVISAATPTPTPTPTPKPPTATGTQWRVVARRLNVRMGPGTGYAVVGTALMNQTLTGTDQSNGWVRLTDGRYVSKAYLVPINAANATGNYTVTASALNVRTGPGSSYKIAAPALPKGTVVNVREVAYGWGNIGYGWVSMNYLR